MVSTMVIITIRCKVPKRLFGHYSFNSFKDLYLWISRNFKNPSYANQVIISVAERGVWDREVKHGGDIKISSSSKLGYKAKEIAREIGLLRSVIGGDRYSRKIEKGLEFAESVDKILD